MKKIFPIIIAMAFLGIGVNLSQNASAAGLNPLANLRQQNYQHVLDDVAAKVVAELPDDLPFRLLAIGPIEGDDGSLTDTLTAKIKTDTRYHLI